MEVQYRCSNRNILVLCRSQLVWESLIKFNELPTFPDESGPAVGMTHSCYSSENDNIIQNNWRLDGKQINLV